MYVAKDVVYISIQLSNKVLNAFHWFNLSSFVDQHIRLYDTTNGQFKEFRNITARDVGWSIIDTDYRY